MSHIINIAYDNALTLDAAAEALIKDVIHTTLAEEGFDDIAEVSVTLVDKDAIHALNKQYRDKDAPTDVLSFTTYTEDGFDAFEDEPVFIGDIVLCYDVAKAQAEEFGHSLTREVGYLVCHSCLHLLGYDHMTEEEKAEMRDHEKHVMSKLGIERRG